MKKLCILFLVAVLIFGCKKKDVEEPLWEFVPKNVCFILVDPYGNNFFDREFEGHILDRPIKIEYEGKTYPLNEHVENQTRVIPPRWYGLREGIYYGYKGDRGTPALLFGEFAAIYRGYKLETFTVDWGDGKTVSEVEFEYYATWEMDKEKGYEVPTVHQTIWVDGQLANENGLFAAATVSPALFDRSSEANLFPKSGNSPSSGHSGKQTFVWKPTLVAE